MVATLAVLPITGTHRQSLRGKVTDANLRLSKHSYIIEYRYSLPLFHKLHGDALIDVSPVPAAIESDNGVSQRMDMR